MTSFATTVRISSIAARCVVAAVLALAGCQTTGDAPSASGGVTVSDPSLMSHPGFLTDYGRLHSVDGYDVKCWRADSLDAKQYDKIVISRIVVTLKTDPKKGIDPTDLKTLVDYFHAGRLLPRVAREGVSAADADRRRPNCLSILTSTAPATGTLGGDSCFQALRKLGADRSIAAFATVHG